MQTVCQLDQDHTDILCHGKKHFSQVFRLHLHLIRSIGQLAQLSNAIYQKCYLTAKFIA